MIAPMALTAGGALTGGEAVLFWVIAPLTVLAALGLLFARKAVYAAIGVVMMMIGLAFVYVAQGATFLGIVQVVVYTGAIMMLFLFVLMLIGVDAAESRIEALRAQKPLAIVTGVGILIGLIGTVASATLPAPLDYAPEVVDGNPLYIAIVLFESFPLTMQLTGALLIIAAVSAITLTSRERITKKVTQRDVAEAKMAAWAKRGTRIAQLPAAGVFATHNATDAPAVSGTGGVVNDSVPRVLRIRGQQLTIAEVAPHMLQERDVPIQQSQLPGMPGAEKPEYPVPNPAPAIAAETGEELEPADLVEAVEAEPAEPEDTKADTTDTVEDEK